MTKDLNLSDRVGPGGQRVLGLKGFSKATVEPRLTEAAGIVTIAKPRQVLKLKKTTAPAPKPAAPAAAPEKPSAGKTSPSRPAEKQPRHEGRRAAMTPEQQADERARRAAQDVTQLDAMAPSEREAELLRRVRIEQRQAVRDWVRQAFPAAFPTRSAPLPLMIGVRATLIEAAALQELPLGAEQIGDFIRHHCRSTAYLASLSTSGAHRHDLDSAVVVEVTEEQRDHAAGELKGVQKKIRRWREGEAAKADGGANG